LRVVVFHWVVRCPVRPRITPPGWDASRWHPRWLLGLSSWQGEGELGAARSRARSWMRASAAWAVSRGHTQSPRMRLWPGKV